MQVLSSKPPNSTRKLVSNYNIICQYQMYMSGTLQKKMGNGRRRELIILMTAVSQKVNFFIVKVSLGNPLSIHALQQLSFLMTPPGRQ